MCKLSLKAAFGSTTLPKKAVNYWLAYCAQLGVSMSGWRYGTLYPDLIKIKTYSIRILLPDKRLNSGLVFMMANCHIGFHLWCLDKTRLTALVSVVI